MPRLGAGVGRIGDAGGADAAGRRPAHRAEIKTESDEQRQIYDNRKDVRNNYLMLMALITLFVLFVATWIALFLAKQISVPITRAAGSRQRGAQGQPEAPRARCARSTNWDRWCAASTR